MLDDITPNEIDGVAKENRSPTPIILGSVIIMIGAVLSICCRIILWNQNWAFDSSPFYEQLDHWKFGWIPIILMITQLILGLLILLLRNRREAWFFGCLMGLSCVIAIASFIYIGEVELHSWIYPKTLSKETLAYLFILATIISSAIILIGDITVMVAMRRPVKRKIEAEA